MLLSLEHGLSALAIPDPRQPGTLSRCPLLREFAKGRGLGWAW